MFRGDLRCVVVRVSEAWCADFRGGDGEVNGDEDRWNI